MPATGPSATPPDARPRLYVVALSHLDTQWRWTERETASDYLPATVRGNDPLFDRFPSFVLSFEGAHRYRLLAEHHPAAFDRVLSRVRAGRWHPAGAAVEAFDALLPAPESILRQIHYGQRWFARRLGRESRDLFLPDCFGFPSTLPTLAAHAGLAGFLTQKLRRGTRIRAARGIPFAYGRWRGPDGAELLAVLDPGEYGAPITGDLALDPAWRARFAELAAAGRPQLLLTLTGVGDRGGALPESTLGELERSLVGGREIEVRHGASDRIFLETSADERERLPVVEGELLLRLHGTGCYTAKGSIKTWNRGNERRARAAEAAAAAAAHLGRRYPGARLENAWWRLLAHQMHDDLPGTSIPAAYDISHFDLALAGNELAEILLDSAGHVARALDRSDPGRPYLLFDPLGAERIEVVELPAETLTSAGSVVGPEGERAPSQRIRLGDGRQGVAFATRMPPFGFAVHRLVEAAVAPATAARADRDALENDRLRARFDRDGNLAALLDKRLGRELLAAPVRLDLFDDRSGKYPAWEILWEDLARGPRARFERVIRREVVEAGPVRAALEIERECAGSRAIERWSLAAGAAGDRLECAVTLDWRTPASLLKAAYRFAGVCPEAAYDTGLGAVRRPVSSADLYEVPAQGWAALDDPERGIGLAVLSDVKAGWDHPDPSTLRSTWIHAPRASFKWRHQRRQDFGRHRFRIALAGFAGEPTLAGIPALAERFANPVLAFAVEPGAGPLPPQRRFELLAIEGKAGLVQALKAADDRDELVLRLRNPTPETSTARVRPGAAVRAARTLDGRERPHGPLGIEPDRSVVVALPAQGLITVGLELDSPTAKPAPPRFEPFPFPGRLRLSASRGERVRGGCFDGGGRSFPAELVPARIDDAAVPFELTHVLDGRAGVAVPDGHELALPDGFAELWLLAASVGGDVGAAVELEERSVVALRVPDWRAPLFVESRFRPRLLGGGLVEAIVRRVPVAWASRFLRDRRGRDLPAEPGLLFALRIPLDGARRLRLPRDPRLRLVAATLADAPPRPVLEATPLLG